MTEDVGGTEPSRFSIIGNSRKYGQFIIGGTHGHQRSNPEPVRSSANDSGTTPLSGFSAAVLAGCRRILKEIATPNPLNLVQIMA